MGPYSTLNNASAALTDSPMGPYSTLNNASAHH